MTVEVDLSGRNAVVTGGGKGIGREICLALGKAGANVFGVSRTEADLRIVGDEVKRLGVRFGHLVADLRNVQVAEQIASAASNALGGIDILVNNAGVADNAPAEQVTEEQWNATMDINVKGAFFLSQAIGKQMLQRGRGRIINVSSQAGMVALEIHAAYGASKAALGMITRVLALEWGGRGVTVNAVAPTVILTPMGERVWGDPIKAQPMLDRIPMGRFGRPPEVASVITFLASDMASLINGAVIAVGGGYTAH